MIRFAEAIRFAALRNFESAAPFARTGTTGVAPRIDIATRRPAMRARPGSDRAAAVDFFACDSSYGGGGGGGFDPFPRECIVNAHTCATENDAPRRMSCR
jgi:hypothetical protein